MVSLPLVVLLHFAAGAKALSDPYLGAAQDTVTALQEETVTLRSDSTGAAAGDSYSLFPSRTPEHNTGHVGSYDVGGGEEMQAPEALQKQQKKQLVSSLKRAGGLLLLLPLLLVLAHEFVVLPRMQLQQHEAFEAENVRLTVDEAYDRTLQQSSLVFCTTFVIGLFIWGALLNVGWVLGRAATSPYVIGKLRTLLRQQEKQRQQEHEGDAEQPNQQLQERQEQHIHTAAGTPPENNN
ncbi:hypothetical protein, conserved [Eimeria maxima]|uniref:Transmembrane protein n=1 Tax=Eimeria maxima TaxID=5804 RepID=U6MIZ8_EIMMA|nr:hypothetical protein, conserved [Eimeria maxima]CDJ61610.1 hypothetical protein, conserved [Eimeria maxima]